MDNKSTSARGMLLMTALALSVFLGWHAIAESDANSEMNDPKSDKVAEQRTKVADRPRMNAIPSLDHGIGNDDADFERRANIAEARQARRLREWIAEDEAEARRSEDVIYRPKVVAGPNANARLSLDLIPNGGAGNQRNDGVISGAVSGRGAKIAIEVFATGTTPLVGMQLRFDFDASLLTFVKAENSAFSLNLPQPTGADFAATSPVRLASSGFLARAEFTTATDVTGREFSIGIASVTLSESASSRDTLTTTSRIEFNAMTTPDFDGDGTVGFPIFCRLQGNMGQGAGMGGTVRGTI